MASQLAATKASSPEDAPHLYKLPVQSKSVASQDAMIWVCWDTARSSNGAIPWRREPRATGRLKGRIPTKIIKTRMKSVWVTDADADLILCMFMYWNSSTVHNVCSLALSSCCCMSCCWCLPLPFFFYGLWIWEREHNPQAGKLITFPKMQRPSVQAFQVNSTKTLREKDTTTNDNAHNHNNNNNNNNNNEKKQTKTTNNETKKATTTTTTTTPAAAKKEHTQCKPLFSSITKCHRVSPLALENQALSLLVACHVPPRSYLSSHRLCWDLSEEENPLATWALP